MKNNLVFKIILYIVGIAQGILFLLLSAGILIRISRLKVYGENDYEIFVLRIITGFFLILFGLTVWGLIKRNAILVYIPTALMILCFIIKFFSIGLGPGPMK